jgi:hypothetical protein
MGVEMAGIKSKAGLVVAVMLCTFELSGLYFGGWARGRMSAEGISSTCMFCISFGPNYFWADAGDSLEMSYDVKTNKGNLSMWIARMTPGNLGDVEGRTEVDSTREGTWRAPISRPGWYHLVFTGRTGQGSYDLDYKLRWRIEHQKPLLTTLADGLTTSHQNR